MLFSYSQPVLVIKKKKSVPTFPGEPARPPASGYHLFSTRMLVELKNTPNTERLQEISRRWRSMGNKQRLKYSKEKDQLAVKYKKDVEVFRMVSLLVSVWIFMPYKLAVLLIS